MQLLYLLGLFMRQCESFEDAMKTALEIKKLLLRHKEEYIRFNAVYCPSISEKFCDFEKDKYWLYCLFSIKFIFFKKHNILCLCGFEYPKPIRELFSRHICFQNSTSQAYPFYYWSDEINLFKRTKEELLKDNEETEEIRQRMYDAMSRELSIYEYVTCKEMRDVEVFSISCIDNNAEVTHMSNMLKRVIYEEIDKEMNKEAEKIMSHFCMDDDVLSTGKIKYFDEEYEVGKAIDKKAAFEIAKEMVRQSFVEQGRLV